MAINPKQALVTTAYIARRMKSEIIRERLIGSGLARVEDIQGCSNDELRQIAQTAGRNLPTGYWEFMKTCGRKAGSFLYDVEIFYPAVLALRPVAEEIVSDLEEPMLELPRSAFVFAMRQKEQFMFFDDESDDPPVMFYMFGWPAFKKIAQSFWDVIDSELKLFEGIHAELKGTPYDFADRHR